MSRPRERPQPPRPWWHWPGLAGCAATLVVLGQFQEQVFAWLARGLRAVGAASTGTLGLSQHSLPASLCYHLLYAGASVGVLHVLLRGRGTRRIVVGFVGALVLGVALLAAGRLAPWPALASQGHLLLDFASSPLALLAGYALAALGPRVPSGARR